MSSSRSAVVAAIRSQLPARVVTNAELSSEVGWTPEEILAKTGIAARHVSGSDECVSDLAAGAVAKLLREANVAATEVQFLILCTQTPDHFLPTTACLVQTKAGLPTSCAAFDINQGCSGYVYALGVAQSFIRSGMFAAGIVATADTYTKLINPSDRSVRTIFGDGATATLVRAGDAPGLEHFVFGTDGAGAKNLIVPAGGMRRPRSTETAARTTDASGNTRSADDLFMNGQEIFAFTLRRLPELIDGVLGKAGLTLGDIDWFVFHQANRFMLEHLQRKLKVPAEKMVWFLENVGNTVSSTIPLALEHAAAKGQFAPGQRLLLAGFGVGYSWGATVLTWR